MSQSSMAQRLDVPQTTWSNYEKGRNQPNLALIDKICCEFGVNLEWLLFGRGETHKSLESKPDTCQNCILLYDKLVHVQERENALLKENSVLKDKFFELEHKLSLCRQRGNQRKYGITAGQRSYPSGLWNKAKNKPRFVS
jgi:transcriptional regulator with XRE-family HTH domain